MAVSEPVLVRVLVRRRSLRQSGRSPGARPGAATGRRVHMTDEELERRVEVLRERIEAAVVELNAPALVLYSAMGWDGVEASVRGGESVFTDDKTRPVM